MADQASVRQQLAECGKAVAEIMRDGKPLEYYEIEGMRAHPDLFLERVMDLGENRIEMRIPRSAWFLRDLRFPHS